MWGSHTWTKPSLTRLKLRHCWRGLHWLVRRCFWALRHLSLIVPRTPDPFSSLSKSPIFSPKISTPLSLSLSPPPLLRSSLPKWYDLFQLSRVWLLVSLALCVQSIFWVWVGFLEFWSNCTDFDLFWDRSCDLGRLRVNRLYFLWKLCRRLICIPDDWMLGSVDDLNDLWTDALVGDICHLILVPSVFDYLLVSSFLWIFWLIVVLCCDWEVAEIVRNCGLIA